MGNSNSRTTDSHQERSSVIPPSTTSVPLTPELKREEESSSAEEDSANSNSRTTDSHQERSSVIPPLTTSAPLAPELKREEESSSAEEDSANREKEALPRKRKRTQAELLPIWTIKEQKRRRKRKRKRTQAELLSVWAIKEEDVPFGRPPKGGKRRPRRVRAWQPKYNSDSSSIESSCVDTGNQVASGAAKLERTGHAENEPDGKRNLPATRTRSISCAIPIPNGKNLFRQQGLASRWCWLLPPAIDKEETEENYQFVGIPRTLSHANHAKWNHNFKQLVAYTENYGHANVHTNSELGRWVLFQRFLYKKKRLLPERFLKLRSVGMEWKLSPTRCVWDDMMDRLEAYHKAYGTCHVQPRSSVLAKWVGKQRARRSSGTLSESQIARLDSIDFPWKLRPRRLDWMKMYRTLEAYRNEHNSTRVPLDYKADKHLGHWVNNQRRFCTDPHRIKLLEKLDFEFHASAKIFRK